VTYIISFSIIHNTVKIAIIAETNTLENKYFSREKKGRKRISLRSHVRSLSLKKKKEKQNIKKNSLWLRGSRRASHLLATIPETLVAAYHGCLRAILSWQTRSFSTYRTFRMIDTASVSYSLFTRGPEASIKIACTSIKCRQYSFFFFFFFFASP